MASWYVLSLTALVLLGSQRFLYKVAAEKGCRTPLTTAVFMGTVTLLSGALFFATGESAGDLRQLFVLAVVNSVSFCLGTVAHMEALRHLPAGITFPLTRLSLLVVILFSVVWLGERPDPLQWLGILLGLVVVFVMAREAGSGKEAHGRAGLGLALVGVCVLCGAAAAISSKLAAVATSKAGFMALSYLLGTFFSLVIDRKWGGTQPEGRKGTAVKLGLAMGLLNFFGFYAFLSALEKGPLSLIALITGMHFVIAIALSVLIYKETIGRRRLLGIGLTLLAVAFLRL